jgi:GDP-4-dehydro-6-deoxy-D-mannose reductase
MRVIVTGAGGFIGWHLVDLLARRGDTVQAWHHKAAADDWQNAADNIVVDITDQAAVSAQLARFAPDAVIHLAAQSFPNRSWDEPVRTYEVNVLGAIHLLEGIRGLAKPPRLLIAGSSAEYAEATDRKPISENAPTRPDSPYGASKLAVDHLVQLYGRRYGLDLVRFRPFFLIGPRKTRDVCSDLARQVVAAERGKTAAVRVGALDVVRDFIDVRDGVAGIARIMDAGLAGEVYNVSGGVGVSIADIVDALRRLAAKPFDVIQDPALMRPLDQKVKVGDNSKLMALGWKPSLALEESLRTILDHWSRKA